MGVGLGGSNCTVLGACPPTRIVFRWSAWVAAAIPRSGHGGRGDDVALFGRRRRYDRARAGSDTESGCRPGRQQVTLQRQRRADRLLACGTACFAIAASGPDRVSSPHSSEGRGCRCVSTASHNLGQAHHQQPRQRVALELSRRRTAYVLARPLLRSPRTRWTDMLILLAFVWLRCLEGRWAWSTAQPTRSLKAGAHSANEQSAEACTSTSPFEYAMARGLTWQSVGGLLLVAEARPTSKVTHNPGGASSIVLYVTACHGQGRSVAHHPLTVLHVA